MTNLAPTQNTPVKLMSAPNGYAEWLVDLKSRIHASQQRAARAVNQELVLLYWQIGREILERQSQQYWGAKVIERLALDLRAAFPEMKGFSNRNLKYMRAFAEAWTNSEFVQEVLAQLPWYHQTTILDKLKTLELRTWYVAKAVENGWSRNMLVHHIDSQLHARTGKAVTNFANHLPAPDADLARESLKDPYKLDFLGLGEEAKERALESAIVDHITSFLLELGAGFAYVGRQVPLEVGGDDFFIDLLFYHLKLHCYVVIELKATDFQPEYAGKLAFYLSAVDSQVKTPEDSPTIGLLLCKNQNRVVAEYSLRNVNKPIGVAEYQLIQSLPDNLKTNLPSIEDIERELTIEP